jgi:hypothetical protein
VDTGMLRCTFLFFANNGLRLLIRMPARTE